MADREKIVEGLEICTNRDWNGVSDCTGCYNRGIDFCVLDLMTDALRLLESKPVAVTTKKVLVDDSYDTAVFETEVFYDCPSCGKRLSRGNPDRAVRFCPACGQGVKWDG